MDYQAGQKTETGYLALPPSGHGPGLLVLHAWWGLNEFFVTVCDRLAEQGYVVVAPDLYAGAIATTQEEAQALADGLDMATTQTQIVQALETLQQLPAVVGEQVGALGFSLGAWWTIQLSARLPEQIAASVVFYGVGDADFSAARCAYLGHFAENDTWEPLEQVQAMEAGMRAAGRDVTVYVYPGVGHWFFESNQPGAYNDEAAVLAWGRTMAFLNHHLREG